MNKYLLIAAISIAVFIATDLCFASGAQPFYVTGTVKDGDQPLKFVKVAAYDEKGCLIEHPTTADGQGNFKIRSVKKITSLLFSINESPFSEMPAFCMEKTGKWSQDAELEVDLSKERLFTLSGKLSDTRKILMEQHMMPGAKWNGRLDHIACQMISIRAFAGGKEITAAYPDKNGAYSIRTNMKVDTLVLSVAGGGVYLSKSGRWSKKATVDFDTAKERLFTITCTVKSSKKIEPFSQRVHAIDKSGNEIATASINGSGYTKFRTNVEIASLKTRIDGKEIIRKGPWSRDADVVIER